ncbi:hypothetical protein COB21_05100 [Candidatus Aerophobetes bacterium]|uniref:Permease n=1 Tax=Aerophobetes bacterium TaxID=2030807 RepID=A0A2A4X1D1_UNCAE|nr:MAG: hypothetical protein COB21_05100 [Candidatus Aerophobetes bacterium]
MNILLWHRYLFFKTAARTALLLLLFFLLYLLIDASIHLKQVAGTLGFFSPTLYLYYTFIFSQMLELFLPLAFLLSATSTLFYLNHHRELLAFQVGGLGKRNLILPFLALSALLMVVMYANEEWVRPRSVKFIDKIETRYLKAKGAQHKKSNIHCYPISDSSKVIFSNFSSEESALTDVFFIRDSKTIFHAKKLVMHPNYSEGVSVDQFSQNSNGHFIKTKSDNKRAFLSLKIDPRLIDVKITPVKHLSLSDLFNFSFSQDALPLFPLAQIKTHFFYKCFIPFLLPLILLFVFPVCTTFSRKTPTLLITAISIFSLVIFYILQNAFLLLGESGVVPPLLSIIIVPIFTVSAFLAKQAYSFYAIRKNTSSLT